MKKLPRFKNALRKVREGSKLHVLLGNGFSRACRDDIFAYGALFERADFTSLSRFARRTFSVLETTDFEVVMRALRHASTLLGLYETSDPDIADQLRRDAQGLREVLVSAIAGSHPGLPADVPLEAYASCKRFLSHFDKIFTVNYDLLLYWALMQEEIAPAVQCDDGFRTPQEGPAEYVTWEPDLSYDQNVYYLHGALHLFDAGAELQKYTWVNTGIPLIQQVRAALEANLYPLFVAEGESAQKLERIRHSAYLAKAHRSFVASTGALLTYGHSFSDSDSHILNEIVKGKFSQLLVGIYGDPGSRRNRALMTRASALAAQRPSRKPLEVLFYDAESAAPWA
jgi:hypothetical protein